MALSRVEALALLPDNDTGQISAADMRAIVEAIYEDGVENIQATSNRVTYMEEVNNGILGGVVPWDGTGSYTGGDAVLYQGQVFMALKAIAPGSAAPKAGPDWAILDYKSQYGTMIDIELKEHYTRAILDGMLTYGGTVKPWDAATDYKTPTSVTHHGMVWYTHAAVVPGGKPPGDHGSPWLPINAINTQAELEDVMNRAFALSGHANRWVAKKPYAKGDTAVVVDDAHHTAQIWRATKAIAAHSPTPAAPDWREVDVAALDDTIQSLTARIVALEAKP